MTTSSTRVVPRSGRLLDLASVACLLSGAVCYGRAWLAMRDLEAGRLVAGNRSHWATEQYGQYWQLSRVGIALLAVGVVVAVAAALVARRRVALAPAA